MPPAYCQLSYPPVPSDSSELRIKKAQKHSIRHSQTLGHQGEPGRNGLADTQILMTDVQDKHSKAAPPLSFLIQTLESHQTSLIPSGDRKECGGRGVQTCTRHRGMHGTEQEQGKGIHLLPEHRP